MCFNKRLYYSEFYYDTGDMSQKLGISEKQVRRNANNGKIRPRRVPGVQGYLWPKPAVDQWIDEGQPISRIPTSPVPEKAFAMCKRNDHSWMGDEEYSGNSYLRESKVDKGQHTMSIGSVHTCYFC